MPDNINVSNQLPSALLVFLCCSPEEIDDYVSQESYGNFQVVSIDSPDDFPDLFSFILDCECDYISFVEPEHVYESGRLAAAINEFLSNPGTDLVISPRQFYDDSANVILNVYSQYHDYFPGKTIGGRSLLQDCVLNDLCLYGDISCAMIPATYAKRILPIIPIDMVMPGIRSTALYHYLLINGNLRYLDTAYVYKHLSAKTDAHDNASAFFEYLKLFLARELGITNEQIYELESRYKKYRISVLKKEITFFYQNQSELDLLTPLMEEASRRGYICTSTMNITQQVVIGVYCSHTNFPENARFSIILLHDMTQGCDVWPLYWQTESWNKYDLGILPGEFWADLWKQNAVLSCARPRYGVFALGFLKNDRYGEGCSTTDKPQIEMKYDKTILYAPSWEYDDKEDDFILALQSLPVNLLIKQNKKSFRSNEAFQFVIDNIDNMRALHEGKYDNLYYLDPDTEFLQAVQLCDLVVSDESSVMTEALLYGIPSVAVTDWLIPDMVPARKAIVPTDWVYRIKRVELRETIEKFIRGELNEIDPEEWKNKVFGNSGHVSAGIMDAIDYYTGNPSNTEFMQNKIEQNAGISTLWN
ncbi:hypothetical protein [Butyrivibrio sp. FCS014]|uniref:hypothetical protein n=1 Tax=Butyrivibrio sp. FCS014 TaxID=1408304 RepID=UPI000467451F|nr:hypothetical protein [Butyrivibrio sp. FCS014]